MVEFSRKYDKILAYFFLGTVYMQNS